MTSYEHIGRGGLLQGGQECIHTSSHLSSMRRDVVRSRECQVSREVFDALYLSRAKYDCIPDYGRIQIDRGYLMKTHNGVGSK